MLIENQAHLNTVCLDTSIIKLSSYLAFQFRLSWVASSAQRRQAQVFERLLIPWLSLRRNFQSLLERLHFHLLVGEVSFRGQNLCGLIWHASHYLVDVKRLQLRLRWSVYFWGSFGLSLVLLWGKILIHVWEFFILAGELFLDLSLPVCTTEEHVVITGLHFLFGVFCKQLFWDHCKCRGVFCQAVVVWILITHLNLGRILIRVRGIFIVEQIFLVSFIFTFV